MMVVKGVLGDALSIQTDPLGSLDQFLDKEKFDYHFARAKEVQATEERAGAVYNKAKPKSGGAAKKKERKWLFMVISEDQIIQDKVRQTSYALLKQNALASTAAVTIFLVVKAIRFAKNIFARKKI